MKKFDLVEFKDKTPGSTGLSHDGIYVYLGECEMKDSANGWRKAIIYSDYHNPEKIYIREEKDFINKFKKVYAEEI